MKNSYNIFYSWQSDLSGKTNRNFINSSIEKAIKELKRKNNQNDFHLEINLDRDTKNKSGSPSISNTIFEKINNADIFIADVSIINNSVMNRIFKTRLTPNPNVLIELGYAVNLLGWERIICLNNLKYGKNEILPFDIRGHKITSFDSRNKNSKNLLRSLLKSQISRIINNYQEITTKHKLSEYNQQDKLIWNQIKSIVSERTLFDSIDNPVDYLFTDKYYYDKWESLFEFYKISENHFIDRKLHGITKDLLLKLDEFHNICLTNFFTIKDEVMNEIRDMKVSGKKFTEEMKRKYYRQVIYMIVKEPIDEETWADANRRRFRVQEELFEKGEEVKLKYQELVLETKKIGLN